MVLDRITTCVLGCLSCLMTGCVVYPVTPDTKQKELSELGQTLSAQQLVVHLLATLGEPSGFEGNLDEGFLKDVERQVSEATPEIHLINRDEFLKALVSKEHLTEPTTIAQVIAVAHRHSKMMGIAEPDYLLFITGSSTSAGTGTYIPILIGVGTTEPRTTVKALIFEWATARVVHQIDLVAQGKGGGVVWIILPFGLFPETESKTAAVLGRLASQKILALSDAENPKLLLLLGGSAATEGGAVGLKRTESSKTAEEGNSEAQMQLYYSTIASDEKAAHQWLCRSADQGHSEARNRLALLFEHGNENLPQDFTRAYVWYKLAADSGHHWGETNARRIQNEHLTAEGFAKARQKFSKWRPGDCASDLGLSLGE